MRCYLMSLTLSLLVLCLLPLPAVAHRVNVFASIQQGDVVVEGSFARGRPAQKTAVEAFLPGQDAPVFRGETDETGMVRFPLPDPARGQGLRIVLLAGEGHRNEWNFSAEDLSEAAMGAALANAPAAATPERAPQASAQGPTPSTPSAAAASQPAASLPAASQPVAMESLEAQIAAAVRRELAPVQRQLAELQRLQAQSEPDVRDIIAGIGFLFGLAGVAMLVKTKR